MLVRSRPNEAQWPSILAGALAHEAADFHLIQRWRQSVERADPQRLRNFFEELLDTRHSDRREHALDVSGRVWNESHYPPSARNFP